MEKIIDGIKKFKKESQSEYVKKYSHLTSGQTPKTLFITCCDSRVVPTTFTSSEPGDLFVFRNVGNKVAPYKNENSYESDAYKAIEYGIKKLKISDIIICGHSECGAMNEDDEKSKQNVIKQIENIKTYQIIKDEISSENLKINGLWFEIKTANVYKYLPETNEFEIIK